jgi:hypothetical protein
MSPSCHRTNIEHVFFLLTIIKQAIAKLKIVSRIVLQSPIHVMVGMPLNLLQNRKRIVKYGLNAFNHAGLETTKNLQ